jgi:hypothetical protein
MLLFTHFWERDLLFELVDYRLTLQFTLFFLSTLIISQPNGSVLLSESATMSSQLPPGGIAFSSDINDHGSDKNRKRPQSMHFPLPFAPAMSPIVYPTPTPNSNEKNEKIAMSDMPDMEMGHEVDDGDAPKPVLFTMPNKRTAFLCPHGLHISDTIVDDDAGLGTESDSQGHLQTRCLVCDVMREYHPYQLQTADPMVGEQWIRYMVSSTRLCW